MGDLIKKEDGESSNGGKCQGRDSSHVQSCHEEGLFSQSFCWLCLHCYPPGTLLQVWKHWEESRYSHGLPRISLLPECVTWSPLTAKEPGKWSFAIGKQRTRSLEWSCTVSYRMSAESQKERFWRGLTALENTDTIRCCSSEASHTFQTKEEVQK